MAGGKNLRVKIKGDLYPGKDIRVKSWVNKGRVKRV